MESQSIVHYVHTKYNITYFVFFMFYTQRLNKILFMSKFVKIVYAYHLYFRLLGRKGKWHMLATDLLREGTLGIPTLYTTRQGTRLVFINTAAASSRVYVTLNTPQWFP